jgi:hypothetical protein
MKKLIIDRFEGSYAICENEDESCLKIPKTKLPAGCREGECLIMDEDGLLQKDPEAYSDRQKRIRDKMDRLFK